MFFFRRKNKEKTASPVPSFDEEDFFYYLRKDPYADGVLLSLSHSSVRYQSENADRDAFTAISREILEGLFSGYWTSAWVWDRVPCYFVLPDGQRCQEKRLFSQAFQEYAKQSGTAHSVLTGNDGRIAAFSQGFYSPFFTSYLSDMSDMPDILEDYFDREMYVYGYQQSFKPSNCFDIEDHRIKAATWDIRAFFDELHDNLLLFIKDASETERVAALTRQACTKYRKNLRLVNLEDPG